uniref:Protein ZIP4 homolog n=1 Tax=Crocodylus porosus TaxID=8502 RepID=A0A7M4E6F0_CROPO
MKRSNGEADIHVHKADVEKDLFKVLSYQAESAIAQGDFQKSVMCVQRCKDMLMRLPKEVSKITFPVPFQKFENVSFLSYEIGKMDKRYSTGQKMQAKVLRLLATVYLEWDCKVYQDKALQAISLANKVVTSSVAEIIHHEVSLDFCLNTAKMLLEHNRELVGFDFLKSVAGRFESSPDLEKVILLHIEFLLQRMREPLAKQKIEDLITGHYTGKQLSAETLNQLHIILWDRAAKNYEVWAKNYPEALQWYNYSLSFYSSGQIDQNLAKLQRNIASCYLHLKQLEQAKEAVKEAEKCDPRSIFTQFNVYKIAVLEGNADKGRNNQTTAAQLTFPGEGGSLRVSKAFRKSASCFQNEQHAAAIKALEYLSQNSQDCQQVFINSHCSFVFQFSQFCHPDKAVLIAQKTCLLMAAAIGLEMGRQNTALIELLTQALQHIQACRDIWKALKPTGDFSKDPTDTLLLLYEFEARAKLNDPALESLLESVWDLPQVESKTLETIASLAMEPPAHYPSVCKKALKNALTIHKKQEAVDGVRISKCLHSLIHLSLPSGVIDADACILEEAWGYFEDALSTVSSTDNYPEVEILWLMTRAWNTGIFQYSSGKYKEAEQWCGLGMRFLHHLGSLKSSYESNVSEYKHKAELSCRRMRVLWKELFQKDWTS